MKPSDIQAASAFAPASVGNVAVGFDVLGHALNALGDRVTAMRTDECGVSIASISGDGGVLPREAGANTAGRAVQSLLEASGRPMGLALDIVKGIPLSSGLGGSAASAVAAVVAAARVLGFDESPAALYPHALAGETVASGAAHGDNVGPQLAGGLVLATADRLVPMAVPESLTAVVVHPDHRVDTRSARRCLAEPFDLATVVAQTGNLALVLAGCQRSDFGLIRAGLRDVMIEPRRAALIPGFGAVQRAALEHGALGASISGAGPTVFAWFDGIDGTDGAGRAMVEAFAGAGLSARAWVSPVAAPGARITDTR